MLTASGEPLDYSFKELRHVMELETEDPRGGFKSKPTARPADGGEDGGEVTAGGPLEITLMEANNGAGGDTQGATKGGRSRGPAKQRCVMRKITTAVKLNNNMLESIAGLTVALDFVMASPMATLQWLNLSFNQIASVEVDLLSFPELKALYLHGNVIRTLACVERLRKLPKLMSLTLNGNPIESSRVYRSYVIGSLQTLRSLDHSTITDDECANAAVWFKGHMVRAKERQERMKYDMPMDD